MIRLIYHLGVSGYYFPVLIFYSFTNSIDPYEMRLFIWVYTVCKSTHIQRVNNEGMPVIFFFKNLIIANVADPECGIWIIAVFLCMLCLAAKTLLHCFPRGECFFYCLLHLFPQH